MTVVTRSSLVAAIVSPDMMDTWLSLRPGRFDRVVYGPLTNTETRRKVLDVHNRSIPLLSSVDLNMMSTRTEGYSGAEVNQQSAMKQLLLLLRKV